MNSVKSFIFPVRQRSALRLLSSRHLYSSDSKETGGKKSGDDPSVPADQLPVTFIEDDEDRNAERAAHIERLRNKSGLLPQHRNMVHDVLPYEQSQSWIHETVKYKRMMLGRYGIEGSGVDPRICFPSRAETVERTEYEKVAFPFTLPQMMATNAKQRKDRVDKMKAREDDIARKLEKLDGWIADLNARVAKKEAEARAAKERKDRLVEEVRRHFGFKVDPRDERFQEMLAQKEKEDRKKVKEAKRREKEIKMMEKLQKKSEEVEEKEEK